LIHTFEVCACSKAPEHTGSIAALAPGRASRLRAGRRTGRPDAYGTRTRIYSRFMRRDDARSEPPYVQSRLRDAKTWSSGLLMWLAYVAVNCSGAYGVR
jgi:hypothetical protein